MIRTKPTIFQINQSNGGVPKTAVRSATLTQTGLASDTQRNKRVHGGPQRALCLYSLENILALQAEGHPIYPGSIGENVTLAAVDWARMLPGQQLKLGDEVIIEVTSYTVPCKQIRHSFADEAFVRVSQKVNPGWARVYAKVLQEGDLQIGDKVELL